ANGCNGSACVRRPCEADGREGLGNAHSMAVPQGAAIDCRGSIPRWGGGATLGPGPIYPNGPAAESPPLNGGGAKDPARVYGWRGGNGLACGGGWAQMSCSRKGLH